MKILAELMSSVRPVWDEPNEGATGAPAESEPTPPGATGEAPAAASEPPATAPAAASDQPGWKDRRIGQLTARNAELARKLAEKNSTSAPAQPDPTADFEARVAAKAAETADALVAVRTFNEKCNEAVDKGRTDFGTAEFNASINGLVQLVDSSDPASLANYQDFLESALETGAAPSLIFELGKDLNEAERILALPPKRRAIELARKAEAVAKPTEPSSAPKPIRVIDAHGGRHDTYKPSDPVHADNLSTAEWMARRNAEVASQAGRR